MALVITIESDLPLDGSSYVIRGNTSQQFRILVQNTDLTPVTLKQLYLTEGGDDVAITLGSPNFKYIGSSLNTTNNVIPASSTNTYLVEIIPQINSITIYPSDYYECSINCRAQIFGAVDLVEGTPRSLRIYRSPTIGYEIDSPYEFWVRDTNKRPPMNAGFDFVMSLNELLEDGTKIPVPINRAYWVNTGFTIGFVAGYSEGVVVQENPYDPVYQFEQYQAFVPLFTPYGGTFTVLPIDPMSPNTGEVVVAVRVDPSGPVVAEKTIWVINSLPVSLQITPSSVQFYYRQGMDFAERTLTFRALLTFNDGTVQDVTSLAAWSISPGYLFGSLGPGQYLISAPSQIPDFVPLNVVVSAYISPVEIPFGLNIRVSDTAQIVLNRT